MKPEQVQKPIVPEKKTSKEQKATKIKAAPKQLSRDTRGGDALMNRFEE
jgi:hypothetical protein